MTVVGTASIPIKLDFSDITRGIAKGGQQAADGLTRDINGRLRDSRGRFVKTGEELGGDFGKGVSRKGKDAADGLTSHFSGAFRKIAGLAGGLFVGAQLVGGLKTAFAEAAEAQKIGRLTEQVIKTTGGAAKISAGQIGDLATSISNKVGIDDEAIQSGANLVATFTKVRNEAGKGNDIFSQTVRVATDMSVALGQDVKTSSLQLGKALNDPIKGVTALSRAGVSFTAQQKEQIKALVESGDLLGAQKIILKEVGTEFGGAAAAAASPVDKLKVVWGNLLEDLGTRALPFVEKLASWLSDMLPKALDIAGRAFGRIGDFLAKPVAVLKEFFYTLTSGFTVDEGTPVEMFALRVRDGLFAIIDLGKRLAPVLVTLWKNFTPLGLIVTHFDGVKTAVRVTGDVIGSFVAGLQGKGGPGSLFTDLGEAARGASRVFREDVVPVLRTVAGFIADHLKPILIGLGAALLVVTGPVTVLAAAFIYAYQKSELFRDIVAGVMTVVKTVVTTVIDWLVFEFKVWTGIIQNVVLPILDRFRGFIVDFVAPLVAAAFRDVVIPAVMAVVHHVQSMWSAVQPILQTVIDFVRDKLGPVWEGMRLVAAAAFQALPGLIQGALRLVGGIVAGFLDGVGSIADAIGLDDIAKVLRNGAGSARGWGQAGPATRDLGAGQLLRNSGGGVPGPSVNRDIVPAMLTPGEFVIRKSAVDKYGAGFMEQINAGRYAKGGLIPDIDLPGLADGIADKARTVGTAALDRVWPRLDTGSSLTGLPAGGANYLRDAVIQLIRGKEAAMGSQSGGGFTRSGGGGPAGQYTAGMQRARAEILNLFGPMAVGGYSNRNIAGTNVRSAHAMHRAWDFMVGLGNVGKGNAVSKYLIDHASSYGLKGLIWNAQSNYGAGWKSYSHPGGARDATSQHLDHVHAEFFNKGGLVHLKNFDSGGVVAPGWNAIRNDTHRDEHLVPARSAPLVENFYANDREAVAEFWQRAEFAAMSGRL